MQKAEWISITANTLLNNQHRPRVTEKPKDNVTPEKQERWDSVWSDGIHMNIWHSNDIIFYIKWFMDTIAIANVTYVGRACHSTSAMHLICNKTVLWCYTNIDVDKFVEAVAINKRGIMQNMLSDLYWPHCYPARPTHSRYQIEGISCSERLVPENE